MSRLFSVPQRVYDRVIDKSTYEVETGCLISGYSIGSHGYAQVGWHEGGIRTMTTGHAVVWTFTFGRVPDGMTIDHTCHRRQCVEVRHLRLLENFENARRTSGRDWPLGYCANGHPNSKLRLSGNKLECRSCRSEWQRRYRKSKRGITLGMSQRNAA